MPRIAAVDLARAVALLGMMATHLGPSWSGSGEPPVSELVAGGRAAPLFALLAGVSLGLVSRGRPEGSRTAPTVLRAACLLVIGLALAALPGLLILVILPVYAVLVVAVLPLRSWDHRRLLWLGGAWALIGPVALWGLRNLIDRPQRPIIQQSFADPDELVGLPVDLLVWGPYPAVVWFAYVVVGLGLSRLDLASAATGRWLVVLGGLLTATALWLGLVVLELGWIDDGRDPMWWDLFAPARLDPTTGESLLVAGQHTSTPLNVAGAIGSAVLILGLAVLVTGSSAGRIVTRPLVAAGSMTLTLYVLHVAATWAYDEHDVHLLGGTYREWAAQAVVLVVLATAWRLVLGRGPLEAAVHAVTRLAPTRTTTAPSPRG